MCLYDRRGAKGTIKCTINNLEVKKHTNNRLDYLNHTITTNSIELSYLSQDGKSF